MVLKYFKTLCEYFYGGTEKILKILQSRKEESKKERK